MFEQRHLALRQRQLALRLRSAELRHDLAEQWDMATAPVRRLAPWLNLLGGLRQASPAVRTLGAGVSVLALWLALRHPVRALGWLGRLRTGLAWWRRWRDVRQRAAQARDN